jgi:hypothetical protein
MYRPSFKTSTTRIRTLAAFFLILSNSPFMIHQSVRRCVFTILKSSLHNSRGRNSGEPKLWFSLDWTGSRQKPVTSYRELISEDYIKLENSSQGVRSMKLVTWLQAYRCNSIIMRSFDSHRSKKGHNHFLLRKNKLRGFSPQADHTDRETAACRRS